MYILLISSENAQKVVRKHLGTIEIDPKHPGGLWIDFLKIAISRHFSLRFGKDSVFDFFHV